MVSNKLTRGDIDDRDQRLFAKFAPVLAAAGKGDERLLARQAVDGKLLGFRLLRAWIATGTITVEDLTSAALKIANIETVAVSPSSIPEGAWEIINFDVCKDQSAVPIAFDIAAKTLQLAMTNPTSLLAVQALQRETEFTVHAVGGTSVNMTLESVEQAREAQAEIAANQQHLIQVVQEEPDEGAYAKLVAAMILDAQTRRAVDIHLEPIGTDLMVMLFRIDGVIQEIQRLTKKVGSRYVNRLVAMAAMDSAANRPADGSATTNYGLNNTKLDLRIATSPTAWGFKKCVIRLLANDPALLNIDQLYTIPDVNRWLEALSTPTGLHLVVGKTGDGKPVAKTTPVLNDNGDLVPIGDLRRGDMVISGLGNPREVIDFIDQGLLPCIRITTLSGRQVIAAHDHLFLTQLGDTQKWLEAKDLTVGQNLLTLTGGPTSQTTVMDAHNQTPRDEPLTVAGNSADLLAEAASHHLPSVTFSNEHLHVNPQDRDLLDLAFTQWRRTKCNNIADPITAIEPAGEVDCCCIEVAVDHTYTVNGLVCHNTTTVAATLKHILDTPPREIVIAIEDPVEIRIPGVSQLPVNTRNEDMSFESILRSVLRQDPDTINIGEIRDKESGEVGIQAVETGHTVFATLHVRSTAGAAGRLIGLGVEPIQIADSLNTVLSQRLMRKLCTTCRKPAEVTDQLLSELSWPQEDLAAPKQIFEPHSGGCHACMNGYHGRFAVPEIMVVTPAIRELIVHRALSSDIHKAAVASGMTPLKHRALEHVAAGETSLEEIRRHVTI